MSDNEFDYDQFKKNNIYTKIEENIYEMEAHNVSRQFIRRMLSNNYSPNEIGEAYLETRNIVEWQEKKINDLVKQRLDANHQLSKYKSEVAELKTKLKTKLKECDNALEQSIFSDLPSVAHIRTNKYCL